MNRSDLIAAVRLYLNRPNLPAEEVGLLINVAEGELNRLLREHPRNVRRVTADVPPDSCIPLPDDIAGLIRVFDEDGAYEQMFSYPLIKCRCYIIRGGILEVHPSVQKRLHMDYHAFLPPLMADAQENWLSVYHSDVYLYGCLKEAAVYLKDDPRLQLWRAEFERKVAELQLQGWNQNIAAKAKLRAK